MAQSPIIRGHDRRPRHGGTVRPDPPLGRLTLGAVKASPQSQLRLLELADLDAELARLDHRRRSLPEVAELARLEARTSELKDEIVVTETELSDLAREQGRAERDVEQVRTRIDRDRARLDAGQVSAARELATLQSEIESLRRRQGDLEEIVLELMERREGLVSRRDELTTERDSLGTETTEVAARRDAALDGDRRAGGQGLRAARRHRRRGARRPAQALRADPRHTRRRRGRVARGPLRGMPPDAQQGGPEPDQVVRSRRGAPVRGVQEDPRPHSRVWPARCGPGPTGGPPRASPRSPCCCGTGRRRCPCRSGTRAGPTCRSPTSASSRPPRRPSGWRRPASA